MNRKDMQIIAMLRQNARMPLTKMSRSIQVPVSTIFDRLKLQEGGLIRKYTSLIDFGAIGYNTRANIAFRVDRDDKDSLRDYLLKSQNINSVYRINNGYDFMVEGVFKQIIDMEDFIEQVDKKFRIQDKKAFFIIEDLKKECFLSDADLLPV
jgi:DNA-binding Lrp family transcriptional regulator